MTHALKIGYSPGVSASVKGQDPCVRVSPAVTMRNPCWMIGRREHCTAPAPPLPPAGV